MQLLFYLLVASLFSIDWLAEKLGMLPHFTTYFAEIFAGIFSIAIVLIAARQRRIDVDGKILLIMAFLVAAYLASAIINDLSAGVIIGGVRKHLKFLPFFILPMVYRFTNEQIRKQLIVLLGLSLVQSLVAFYQRFVKYASDTSGDMIGGTLGANSSGILSVWLACAITVVFSFYLAKQLKGRTLIVLLIVLASPMMINETKISFFLIPLALLIPAFFSSSGEGRVWRVALSIGATATIFTALVFVYDSFKPNKPISDWFMADDATEYVYRGSTVGGGRDDVKRLDAIRIAYKKLQYENALAFGLGPGNVSPAFARQYEGKYFRRYQHFMPAKAQLSLSMWETGLIGSALLVLLAVTSGGMAYRLARSCPDDLYRALALGWGGVTVMIILSLAYFATFVINLFACLFWFYSGTIVAKYSRQRRASEELPNREPLSTAP